MKQSTKAKRLIVLLARNHTIEEIKTLLNMKSETNKKFIEWVDLTLSYPTYKEMFVREKVSVLAKELNVEHLPF